MGDRPLTLHGAMFHYRAQRPVGGIQISHHNGRTGPGTIWLREDYDLVSEVIRRKRDIARFVDLQEN